MSLVPVFLEMRWDGMRSQLQPIRLALLAWLVVIGIRRRHKLFHSDAYILMPAITIDKLASLQSNTANIRNICILAHVDHGKTTLSDSLLASNGIISSKLAGKLRYLDSREDEQLRGITMESSGISLLFGIHRAGEEQQEYLINLIDSPGHVDFSSEVSTASRVSDGGLVLVDVVEGVCTQTRTVLRQAWQDKVQPVLVINKLDRLITELMLTPMEAYEHLQRVLEQVNAIMGQFYASDVVDRETRRHEMQKEAETVIEGEEEEDDEDIYFSPEKGNVVFSSAIDGWAFRVGQFARMYAIKLGMNEALLRKTLWGNYYLDPKTKSVISHKRLKGRSLRPMFVQFVLENIWRVYEAVMLKPDQDKVIKIVGTLGLKLSPRDLATKEPKTLINTILGQWLPLSRAVLMTVVDRLPNPVEAQKTRMQQFLEDMEEQDKPEERKAIEQAVVACDARPEAPMVAYISKMFAVPRKLLPERRRKALTAEEMRARGKAARERLAQTDVESVVEAKVQEEEEDEDAEVMIGFARIYSGKISVGQTIHVLGPKYDASQPDKFKTQITVSSLYMIMGRDVESLESVAAGNVFGIGGLEGIVLKTATLSTHEACPSLGALRLLSAPIVRVALEPEDPTQMDQLVQGLKLLNQADPAVQVVFQETGEHVIVTAGELHLERCLKDLKERYAKIDIHVSSPIVPFRETLATSTETKAESTTKAIYAKLMDPSSRACTLTLRVHPLPHSVTEYLLTHQDSIQRIYSGKATDIGIEPGSTLAAMHASHHLLSREDFFQGLKDAFAAVKVDKELWQGITDKVWSFGPKRCGPNLLINNTGAEDVAALERFEENIITGFQLATASGPLCGEPMQGVCFFLDNFSVQQQQQDDASLSGQVITTTKDTCRKVFMDQSPRLMLAMYSCDIQASSTL
jgi:ribosome assembly protein 1